MLEHNSFSVSSDRPFIVSSEWLERNRGRPGLHILDASWKTNLTSFLPLGRPGLHILDASWYLPDAGRDPEAEYRQAHIPGAVFFDHEKIADRSTSLPLMLPAAAVFAHHAGAMGISRDDTVVVYDGDGFFSAPRVWWLFRIMGAEKVYVLDGGFRGWKKERRPVTAAETAVTPAVFDADPDRNAVVMLDEMRRLVAESGVQIADARGRKRFTGEEAEPKSGIRSGHMPGARNVPLTLLSENGHLKTPDAIRAIFVAAGINPDKPVVTTCGSGMTAAGLVFALQSLGNRNVRLYDGSWSEWGNLPDTAVEKGEAT